MTTSIRTSADGLSSIIAVNGVDRFSIDQNGKATAVKFAGDGSELTGVVKAATAVATTSGTSKDFTGIPAWCNRVTLILSGVSTSGTVALLLQLGDAGGVENTGYSGMVSLVHSSGVSTYTGVTSGVPLTYSAMGAADTYYGTVVLVRVAGNAWVISGSVYSSSTLYQLNPVGGKTLSDTLDRIRLTTTNGTDVFDAGQINILYE